MGHLGQHHARIYASSSNAELVGVADIKRETAEGIAKRYSVSSYTDYHELLPHVEAVSIAVPTLLHHKVAKDCLLSKLHILVEKPITVALEEAEELLNLSAKFKRIVQVGHIERFNAALQALQKISIEPKIIEAHRLGPFTTRAADVGVVLDLMIHDIDIVLSLVNSPVAKVDAIGMSILSPYEDVANARIQFANGCVANITASRVSREKQRLTMVFQKDVYILIDYTVPEITVYRKDPLRADSNDPQSSIVVEKLPLVKDEPLRLQLEHFLRCVANGEEPLASGYKGKQALELALVILKSIHK